jgi:GNAT superfamily N-acetyltransferase
MTITCLTIRELETFVASEEYRRMTVLPISPQRAISQAKNPRAQPEDVVLALAWEGDELIGYRGAVPDQFFIHGDTPQRMAWLSCIWVSPAHRGKGVAKKLVDTMLEAWQNRVILTEFSPEVSHLYRRSDHFTESMPLMGYRGYLRPNFAQILPPKKPIFETLKPLLRLADALLAIPNDLRISLFHQKKHACTIQAITKIDQSTAEFIAAQQQGELARRDRQTLNWMLQNPWVKESPEPDDVARRYHFTASARQFQTRALQLLNSEGQTIGVLLLTIRDGHLRVPHAWHADEHSATVASVIFAEAIQLGAKMMTLFHPRFVAFCKENRSPFFWEKPMERTYFVGKGLSEILAHQPLILQDGDGDVGFT